MGFGKAVMKYFKKPNLSKLKIWFSAGNHDCYGNIKNEIEFVKRYAD